MGLFPTLAPWSTLGGRRSGLRPAHEALWRVAARTHPVLAAPSESLLPGPPWPRPARVKLTLAPDRQIPHRGRGPRNRSWSAPSPFQGEAWVGIGRGAGLPPSQRGRGKSAEASLADSPIGAKFPGGGSRRGHTCSPFSLLMRSILESSFAHSRDSGEALSLRSSLESHPRAKSLPPSTR